MTKQAPSRSTFPKMGTDASRVQAAASQSPNVKNRPRSGSKNDAPVGTIQGVKPHHQERLGAKYAPQMTMVSAEAPEAGLVGRNVRILPSSTGNRDFWLKRQYGQRLQ